jgi:hypothetical protein
MNGPLANIDVRVCQYCLGDENDTGHAVLGEDCQHAFVERSAWIGLAATTTFDMDAERVRSFFGEMCFDASDYLVLRQLTADEIALINSGDFTVEIRIAQRAHADNPQPAIQPREKRQRKNMKGKR